MSKEENKNTNDNNVENQNSDRHELSNSNKLSENDRSYIVEEIKKFLEDSQSSGGSPKLINDTGPVANMNFYLNNTKKHEQVNNNADNFHREFDVNVEGENDRGPKDSIKKEKSDKLDCFSPFERVEQTRPFLFSQIDVYTYIKYLEKEHFILFEYPDKVSYKYLVDVILNTSPFGTASVFNLDLDKQKKLSAEEQFQLIYDFNGVDEKIDILIIELNEKQFNNLIRKRTTIQLRGLKRNLKLKQLRLIYFFRSESAQIIMRTELPDFYFEIDFLKTFLYEHVSQNKDEIQTNYTEIASQRNNKLWDKPKNNYNFYQILSHHLQDGTLTERIKRGNNKNTKLEELKPVKVSELVGYDDSASKTILFIVTFFDKLKLKDFRGLVQFYLTIKEDKGNRGFNKKGKKKKKKRKVTQSFLEDWEQNYKRIFDANHLNVKKLETKEQVVSFKVPYLQQDLYEYFEESDPIYFQKNFEYLLHSEFLLHYEGSDQLVNSFVKFLAVMAAKDPEHYGTSALIDIVRQYGLRVYQIKSNAEQDNDHEYWSAIFSKDTQKIISRLADLIHEILQFEHLGAMVKEFFDMLLVNDELGIVVQIIAEVANREGYSEHFDMFYWLKEIIKRDQNEDNQELAYQLMLRISLKSPFSIYRIFELILSWKDELRVKDQYHSLLFDCCNRFIVDFCKNALSTHSGGYQSFIFFKNLDGNNTLEILLPFIKLLFDQDFIYTELSLSADMTKEDRFATYNNIQVQRIITMAAILESLNHILLEDIDEGVDSEAISIRNALLKASIRTASKYQLKNLIAYWRFKKEYYLEESIRLLNAKKKIERKEIRTKRQYLVRLIKAFNTILKESKKEKSHE
ncbi:hypothetical protein [Hyunsoonleella pacifica]|uniref:Uncharacterized protein n=1 Tax=Hyunsoonleella pacifica TaxID=1080224 RepID=A0A4Q9FW97_9FLAO|nr:hypothetical protein [Hyunsoonleella pacifica]TBN18845.1 hypothetical protein EYD46_01915 [Hyunsoonleella pacifica]GGD05274.1 hypothetical protein GCM10011368_03830 [Hyunsoonleella pacifica]